MLDLILSFLTDLLVLAPGINWRRRRDRPKEWSGTVETKKTRTVSRYAYLVTFRTVDGEKKKLYMDRKEDFDLYEEGRRYIKRAGQDLPDAKPIG